MAADPNLSAVLSGLLSAVADLIGTQPSGNPAAAAHLNIASTAFAEFQAEGLPPSIVTVPNVSGAAVVGGELICTMGIWHGAPTDYSYEWMSDAGSTALGSGSTYTVADTDAGHSITCVVTATNAAGSTAAPPSNAIAIPAGTTTATSAPAEKPAEEESAEESTSHRNRRGH
jgi:hypothetical protein